MLNTIRSTRAAAWCAIALLSCGGRSDLSFDVSMPVSSAGSASNSTGGTANGATTRTASGGTTNLSSSGGTSTLGETGGSVAAVYVTAISVGNYHSCALLSSGTIRCWGSNIDGRLGAGTQTSSSTPVAVQGISSAQGLDCGNQHNCAVLTDGTVRCWGRNDYGQLGDGTTSSSPVPVRTLGLVGVQTVSVGNLHSCALLETGDVWCWGANADGQLGQPNSTSSVAPIAVSGLTGVQSLDSGMSDNCALLTDIGTVACWGANAELQLGSGSSAFSSYAPATVQGLSGASAVAAGNQHSCALVDANANGGSVRCWGWNYYGQSGGTATPDTGVTEVAGITNATALTAADHSCARLLNGQVKCWGFNHSGELGDGTVKDSSTPVTVLGVSNAIIVSAGAVHTCALLLSGTVQCWGDNTDGQLGDGTTNESHVPVTVVGLP